MIMRYRIERLVSGDVWKPAGDCVFDLRTPLTDLYEVARQFARAQQCQMRIVVVTLLTFETIEIVKTFDVEEPVAES
jgi:hypothetical protein